MNTSAILDVISCLALMAGMFWMITSRKQRLHKDTRLLISLLMLCMFGYEAVMAVEWLGFTHALESFENIIGAMIPMMWAFLLYSLIQLVISKDIRESEERLNLAIQGTRAGLWDWHIKSGEFVCNEQWANMIGYDIRELSPLSFKTWAKLTHPEDVVKSDEILELYLKGKIETYECETRMHHKQGHWVWVLDRGMVVERDHNGIPLRMTGTHIDITKQKITESQLKAQMDENQALNEEYLTQNEELIRSINRIQKINEELEVAKHKAEESDRLKSSFLANMSHEIRTPMNGIIGFSEIMADPKLDPLRRAEYAKIVIDSSKQLLSIVNDILDISRIEAGLVCLSKEEVCVNELIQILFAFFEPQARNKNILLRSMNSLSHEASKVYTDKTRLRQVLTNLLNNALKFTDEGEIEFGYLLKGDALEFYVRDSGIGIPVVLHEKIFEPFLQVETEISYYFGGTGLGLSISRKLTELLGGKIWLESQPGTGSVFYFTLPYNHPVGNKILKNEPERVQGLQADGKLVLIAEDDDTNYLYLETALAKTNIRILRASDGIEALEICKNDHDIHFVLMDIKLPLMDGYEATRKIKQVKPDLPIIAQTAYAMNEDRKKALDAGCDDYISKPIRLTELMSLIEKYCC
jgi:PAS domain S-box-containing protein